MDVAEIHRRSVEHWCALIERTGPGDWAKPTPNAEWDVRTLVNHVVGEQQWTVPLLDGRTIAEVGDRLDGDLLGDDPHAAAVAAATAACAAFDMPGAAERTVHLSYGDETAQEYGWQLVADHLIHGWDLAVATGQDAALDPALVEAVAGWYVDRAHLYRQAGLVGPAAETAADADAQARLVAAFGREPTWSPTLAAVERFGAAFARADVDTVMALMTADCVFESTSPAPGGRRVVGAAAVRAEWEALFGGTHEAEWTWEETIACGERATVRWRFAWRGDDGLPGHVRGVDVLRLRDGKVAEKMSYVKG